MTARQTHRQQTDSRDELSSMESADPFVKIVVLENTVEAQIIQSLLDQYGIPHRLRSYHDTAYDGLFQFQRGWGELLAPESRRREILEMIQILRSEKTPP
jgi:hypothetical protein